MLVEKLPKWFLLAARRRYQQSVQTIDKVVFKAIQRNRQSGHGNENLIAMLPNLVDADPATI
jgi:hypothetical protein